MAPNNNDGISSDSNIPLLSPYQMGPFSLSIRMVYAPLTRCRAVNRVPQPIMKTYYEQRAHKGALMLSEGTCISETAHGYPHTPGINLTEHVEAWKPIVQAVHDKGSVFFCQLWHCGRASHPDYQPNGALPIAPSALPITSGDKVYISTGVADYPTPRALETEEIPGIVEEYRLAARNAIDAGFDGVEIHGGNGYLIDEFLKDGTNKRTDKYGGSVENRTRFLLEIVEAVGKEVGLERVGVRLTPFNGFLDMQDSDPVGHNVYVCEKLSEAGVVYVHCVEPRVQGNEDREKMEEFMSLKPLRQATKGPTFIAAGGYKRDNGNEAVATGHADLITYGRLFLSNPDLPERFEKDAPLNKYDRATFYGAAEPSIGYTDYPFLEEVKASA